MSVTLNFSIKEKDSIKEQLSAFPKIETKTGFEEARWKILDCTVTLYSTGKLVVQGKKKQRVKELILSKVLSGEEIQLGIDESGRGEDFGPLVVAGVLGDKNKLRELRDSKKTRDLEKKKEIVSKNALAITTVEFSSSFIDLQRKKGHTLNEFQAKAIKSINFAMNPRSEWPVLVDGKPLKGCNGYTFLTGGDDLNPVIGAASIIAKQARENSEDKKKRKTWKKSD